MNQDQLSLLIHEFQLSARNHYPIARLLNDADFRNQCLEKERYQANSKILLLINQIQDVEDLMHHANKADWFKPKPLADDKPKRLPTAMVAFALCCLTFITGSVAIVERFKF